MQARSTKRTHITLADFDGASIDQRQLFAVAFGEKAMIGKRSIAFAKKIGLDISWLERLIPQEALAEYNKKRKAAFDEYYRAMSPEAWILYDKANAKALIAALTHSEG